MNTYITGTVHHIAETQTFPSGFSKRQLVVNTGGEYPQFIPIDFVKDKCSILDKLSIGQAVSVSVNIRDNEYNDKYYVNLQGWKLDAQTSGAAPSQPQSTEPAKTAEQSKLEDMSGEDIPF